MIVTILFLVALAQRTLGDEQSATEIQALIDANKNNVSALHTIAAASLVNSPNVRGTIDIVWSCLITLVACVYTALHLNIPQGQGTWAMLETKARWVLLALLAPEIVLYTATNQFFEARELQHNLREILAEKKAHKSPETSGELPDSVRVQSIGLQWGIIRKMTNHF
jgi:hypothetical protein